MALSLELDPEVFLSAHRLIASTRPFGCHVTLLCLPLSLMMPFDSSPKAHKNGSTLRSLFYGPVRREKVQENQLRCGEHSDYGSITLLFQGSEGLQVPLRCHSSFC